MSWLRNIALIGASGIAAVTLLACGDDDAGPEPGGPSATAVASTVGTGPTDTPTITPRKPSPSTGGTAGGPEPVVQAPAAAYTVLLEELKGDEFEPYPPNTFLVNRERFELLGQFTSGLYAAAKVLEWNYVEGWSAEYAPLGRLSSLVNGGHFVNVDTYLFSTPDGAREAYQSFLAQYRRTAGSLEEQAAPLGNESAAFSVISGTVGRTDTPLVYHRFIFRRGNLIGIVQTTGGEPFMSNDLARDYAIIIDNKALGVLPPQLPTPFPSTGG